MTTHDFRPGDVVECREWDGDEWTPATVSSIGITGRVHMRTADGAAVSCSEHMAPTCIRYRECEVCAAKPGTPALCADCLERRARLCKPAITIQRPGEWSAGDTPTEHPSRSRAASSLRAADPVDHPSHYTDHPSGVECITVTEHMNFNVGNAVKYLWRAGRKGDALTDLRKAAWYVNREIERLTREAGS